MNLINYREDESIFKELLKAVVSDSSAKIRLATGYFNLQKEFINEVVKAKEDGQV